MTRDGETPTLTLAEAVTATQTSESTIKRRLRAGAFPNAARDADGKWMIPLGDLSAAGLRPGRMAKPDPKQSVGDLAAENAELRQQLAAENAELRQRLAVAEALASERNRIIEVQQQMLRMLEARPAPAPDPAAAAPPPPPAASPPPGPTTALGRLRRRFLD